MYVPTALPGLLHWKVCIPVLTAQGLLRTQNFAGRAHFYWQRHVVRHKSCLVTIWKSSMAWDKTLTFQGEWILSPFSLEPGWKALQQNVRDLQRGHLRDDMTTVAAAQEKLCLYFYYKGTAWRGGKNPFSATLQCMWQTGLIPTCQHPFQTPPGRQKSISKRRQLSVATSQRNPPVTHPPAQWPQKPLHRKKKLGKVLSEGKRLKKKKSPRKNNLRNTISCFQNLYQCQIII